MLEQSLIKYEPSRLYEVEKKRLRLFKFLFIYLFLFNGVSGL